MPQDAFGCDARIGSAGRQPAELLDVCCSYDESGRLTAQGACRAPHDGAGRLANWETPHRSHTYGYDAQGRLVSAQDGDRQRRISYGDGPAAVKIMGEASASLPARFDHDAHGRRIAAHDSRGTTRYAYNLYGQLNRVDLPDGANGTLPVRRLRPPGQQRERPARSCVTW